MSALPPGFRQILLGERVESARSGQQHGDLPELGQPVTVDRSHRRPAGGLSGMTEVQYKGSTPAHPDVIANRITFMIDPLAAASPHIRAGLLRALAVSTPQRNPSFPDVPAAAEAGLPGYDFASWGGMFAPAGTPRTVVQKLNAEIGAALAAPDLSKRFNDMGLVVKHSTPEEFGKFLPSEIARWRELLAKKP